jgi:hypothetical protein
LSNINPAIASGTSRISGSASQMGELSGVTVAPPFGNVLARYEKEPHEFNGDAGQTKSRLRRNGMKQPNGRNRNKPSGRHEEEARKFQSATVTHKIA